MHKRHRGLLLIGGALAATLALAACAPTPTTGPRTWEGGAIANPPLIQKAQPNAPAGPREITVRATEFAFEPKTIELTAGQPVRLVLKNDGRVLHDFAVPGLEAEMHEAMGKEEADGHGAGAAGDGHAEEAEHDTTGASVHANAGPGMSVTIEFTPTSSGTYQAVCTLPGHKEAGMVGQVRVAQSPVASH